MLINGYRCMWVLTMFDLPTDTKKARKQYADFRKYLLKDGFMMMQYSVYIRHCASKENAEVHTQRITQHIPADGEVRVITITDKQFERMSVFWGKMHKVPERVPCQLELF